MRYILLILAMLAFVGCGSDSGSQAPTVTQPVTSASAIEVAQIGDVQTFAPETLVIGNQMKVTVTQPALGWMPRWNVVGGTLTAGDTIFNATITPTADQCIVTITWYQLDGPPGPPSAFN